MTNTSWDDDDDDDGDLNGLPVCGTVTCLSLEDKRRLVRLYPVKCSDECQLAVQPFASSLLEGNGIVSLRSVQ